MSDGCPGGTAPSSVSVFPSRVASRLRVFAVALIAVLALAPVAVAQSSAEARRARAAELVKEILSHPPLVRGQGRPVSFRKPLEELVKLGAEGQVAALRMVPKARDLEAVAVLYFLGTELATKPLELEAVKPATEALPVAVRLYVKPPEGGNYGQKLMLAAMARTEGLLEPVLDALTAQPRGVAVVMDVVGGVDPKALGPALVKVAADATKPPDMRLVAVQGLGMRKDFQGALLAVARGEVPAAARDPKAAAGTGPRYRFDDGGGAKARGLALLMLSSKSPTNPEPPAELARLAESALGGGNAELADAAASTLGRLGPAGQEVLLRHALAAPGGAASQAAMAELTKSLPYPKALLADREAMARPEARQATARVLALLSAHAGSPADAARELNTIVDDAAAPAELRRQAAVTLLNGGEVTRAVSDARLGEMVGSKFAEVRLAAATALAEVQDLKARPVTAERLTPLLEAPEPALRKLAVARLLPQDYRYAQVRPEVALRAMGSKYEDVRVPAANLLANSELLRRHVGLVSGAEVMKALGRTWEGPAVGAEGSAGKATWPAAGARGALAPVAGGSGNPAASGGDPAPILLWILTVLALAAAAIAPVAALAAARIGAPVAGAEVAPVGAAPVAPRALSNPRPPPL